MGWAGIGAENLTREDLYLRVVIVAVMAHCHEVVA